VVVEILAPEAVCADDDVARRLFTGVAFPANFCQYPLHNYGVYESLLYSFYFIFFKCPRDLQCLFSLPPTKLRLKKIYNLLIH
jgi:hypothetical protein